MESNNNEITRHANLQFRFLVGGAVLFVGWHILGIVLRS